MSKYYFYKNQGNYRIQQLPWLKAPFPWSSDTIEGKRLWIGSPGQASWYGNISAAQDL